MINVVVELWPYGEEANKKVIDSFQIANDGTGTHEKGNYLFRWNETFEWKPCVKDHDRHNSPSYLVYLALKKQYDKE